LSPSLPSPRNAFEDEFSTTDHIIDIRVERVF
jgi:hypothetical protein